MKKIGSWSIVGGALAAAVIGLAGPAQADHNDNGSDRSGHGYYSGDSNSPWLGQLVPNVKVPHVDTSVRN